MTLAESLAAHYIDACTALDDGVVTVNGELAFSPMAELLPGDVVVVQGVLCQWTIEE